MALQLGPRRPRTTQNSIHSKRPRRQPALSKHAARPKLANAVAKSHHHHRPGGAAGPSRFFGPKNGQRNISSGIIGIRKQSFPSGNARFWKKTECHTDIGGSSGVIKSRCLISLVEELERPLGHGLRAIMFQSNATMHCVNEQD